MTNDRFSDLGRPVAPDGTFPRVPEFCLAINQWLSVSIIMYRCSMMYMCSISRLVTEGLPNVNVMLRAHAGVVSAASHALIQWPRTAWPIGSSIPSVSDMHPWSSTNTCSHAKYRREHVKMTTGACLIPTRDQRPEWTRCTRSPVVDGRRNTDSRRIPTWTLSLEFMLGGLQGSLGAR